MERLNNFYQSLKITAIPKLKILGLVYLQLLKTHPVKTGLGSLLIIGFIFGDRSGVSSGESDSSKDEYIVRCWNYAKARQECAAAADISQCITIKTSYIDYSMASMYCNGSMPNWALLGKKP